MQITKLEDPKDTAKDFSLAAIDLVYVFGEFELDEETALYIIHLCTPYTSVYTLLGDDLTGHYRFKRAFHD